MASIAIIISTFIIPAIVYGDDSVCPEGEIFTVCKHPYQPSCQSSSGLAYDPDWCVAGCICKPGFIKDESSGKCVHPTRCPINCPANEVQNYYGEHNCESSCQDELSNFLCQEQNKKCICKRGFLRDHTTGKCVLMENCPEPCKENEEFSPCTNPFCSTTCQNRTEIDHDCTQENICKSGCVCRRGYIKDEISRKCIPENQCPNECGVNQEWVIIRFTYCRKTCQNRVYPLDCPLMNRSGCDCKPGYFWDEESRRCVYEENCPFKTTIRPRTASTYYIDLNSESMGYRYTFIDQTSTAAINNTSSTANTMTSYSSNNTENAIVTDLSSRSTINYTNITTSSTPTETADKTDFHSCGFESTNSTVQNSHTTEANGDTNTNSTISTIKNTNSGTEHPTKNNNSQINLTTKKMQTGETKNSVITENTKNASPLSTFITKFSTYTKTTTKSEDDTDDTINKKAKKMKRNIRDIMQMLKEIERFLKTIED